MHPRDQSFKQSFLVSACSGDVCYYKGRGKEIQDQRAFECNGTSITNSTQNQFQEEANRFLQKENVVSTGSTPTKDSSVASDDAKASFKESLKVEKENEDNNSDLSKPVGTEPTQINQKTITFTHAADHIGEENAKEQTPKNYGRERGNAII